MSNRSSFTPAHNWLLGEDHWRETVLAAVNVLELEAAKVGLRFQPSHEPTYLDDSDAPLNPRYVKGPLTGRNFFCILGDTPDGTTRQAVRLYNWYDGASLASEARALRIYYDHPSDAQHTDYALYDCPIADRINGRVAFNGAVWVHPDLRGARPELDGRHVAQIISPLSRLLALYLFDVDWCIATTKETLVGKGVTARYGWAGIEPGVRENIGSIGGDPACWLMWSHREDILAEATRIARDGIPMPAQPRDDLAIPAMG